MRRFARIWHGLTLVVVVVALTLQLVLVIDGAPVLDESDSPPLGTALFRFFSYFTIQSNIGVGLAAAVLAARPAARGLASRVLRLTSIVGITVTGVIHFFLLRPLQDLEGAPAVADTLLHVVVPAVAVIGWALYGPRPRVTLATVGLALVWPVLWLAGILAAGAPTDWYPYPFIDVAELGYPTVLRNAAGVTAVFLALFGIAAALDRALPPAPPRAAPR
jgi:hypothetical protein